MVKSNLKERQVIGEIQLIFGIILLILAIIGIVLDYSSYNNIINQNLNTLSVLITQSSIIIGILCILGIILSLFFITQGLLNSSEKER